MKYNKIVTSFLSATITGLLLSSCTPSAENIPVENKFGSLPTTIKDPADNPGTPEKIELGRLLFWDPILSGNKDIACSSCHHPDLGYADNLDLSSGVGGHGLGKNRKDGTLVQRNAPTIINTAFNGINSEGAYDPSNAVMFVDNRKNSLEEQVLEVVTSLTEMRGEVYTIEETHAILSMRLKEIPEYVTRFNAAFGKSTEINADKIAKVIAAYERTLIANNSRFDQYARGDNNALTNKELSGMKAFIASKCNVCHSGPMFSDYKLHNIGVANNPRLGFVDEGAEGGKFRTPSLRNISLTGPYMHNGMEGSLRDAVAFYEDIDKSLDPDLQQLDLEDDDTGAIVAFIQTLNDDNFDKTIPAQVPSGLKPGGNID